MSKIITGLFESPSDAARAVDALINRGVSPDAISVIASESMNLDEFAITTKSKVAEGAAIGAGVGGGIAAIIAGFTVVGTLATSGVGLLAAGPLVAALAGAGAGAAVGGALGGLIGLGIPEHEVKYYEDALSKGSVLIGVDNENVEDDDMVKDILKHHDVQKVSSA